MRQLNNRLQLPGVAKCILDHRAAGHQDVPLGPCGRLRLNREVYPSITEDPAALLRKLNNCTFRLQEEEVFGVRNREGGIGLLRAVGDFAADGADKDLDKLSVSILYKELWQSVIEEAKLTFENSPKSSEGTRSDLVSRHTLS